MRSFLLQIAECGDSTAPAHCFSAAPTRCGTTRQFSDAYRSPAPSPAPQMSALVTPARGTLTTAAAACKHRNWVPTHAFLQPTRTPNRRLTRDPFSPTRLGQKKNAKRDTHGGTRTHSLEMFARRVEVSRATDCATRADLMEAVGSEHYDSADCALATSRFAGID